MSFIKTFTDPQGTVHTNAVFEVAYATKRVDNSDSYNVTVEPITDVNGLTTGYAYTPLTNSEVFRHINYRMYYWTNQASKDAGNLPYVLASLNPIGEIHSGDNLDATYDTLTTVQMAEKHCKTVVLA